MKNLYRGVTYPVSRGTKMLSSLVKWDHSVSWLVPVWRHKDSFGQIISVNISNEQHAYLAGHNIDGRFLMPATGYLVGPFKDIFICYCVDLIYILGISMARVCPPTLEGL